MAKAINIDIPMTQDEALGLRVRDIVYLNGVVYTARDMAHLRIAQYIKEGKKLPEDFAGAVIFHAGPAVKKEGQGWGLSAIGPTTSIRMEPYSDLLGRLGVRAIVGKGGMEEGTSQALKKYGAVYLLAAPGCGAKHTASVERVLRVHWLEELGMPEAIWVLEVRDWGPLVVGMDSQGNSIFRDIAQEAAERVSRIFGEE